MSSMFKKKGGPAFKPKIPSARPSRPAVPSAPTPASKATEDAAASDTRAGSSVQDTIEASASPAVASEDPPAESQDSTPRSPRRPSETPPTVAPGPTNDDASTSDGTVRFESSSGAISEKDKASSTRAVRTTPVPIPGATPIPPPATRTKEPPKPRSDDIASRAEQPSALPVASTDTSAPTASARSETPVSTPISQSGQQAATETPKPGATRKRQKKPSQNGEEPAQPRPRKRKTSAQEGEEAQPKKRARSLTPEDAENQVVDLQALKMSDLTKDLHIGKKFSRHDELRERERQARIKARLKKDDDQPAEETREGSGTPAGDTQGQKTGSAPAATPPASQAPASGPQFRIVDGQIVIDQNSLVMDRHARAAAAQAGEEMETVEENDFTRLITSSSFMSSSKLKGPNFWTEQETELFYRGLGMLGTDFEMISKMFPGKQRRHVKLKFNREERHRPALVDAALTGKKTIKIDMDEYQAATGGEYETVESIEAEQRRIQEGYEAEQKRVADEQAEIMRKKREELFADEDGGNNGNAANAAGKKKKRGPKKKGKEAVSYGLNGEPITTS